MFFSGTAIKKPFISRCLLALGILGLVMSIALAADKRVQAELYSYTKTWRTNNQMTEVCNNQVDDDGDGLIDCHDPDCVACACDYSSTISFSNSGANTNAGYTQVYVLTDSLGLIVATSATTQFTGLAAGKYRVYALNYATAQGITNLMSGNNISTVAGGCIDISLPLLFTLCACPDIDLSGTSNSPIFAGSSLDLSANATGGAEPYTYNWTGPNGFSAINNPSPSIPNATPAMSGMYVVVAIDANGCEERDTVTVVVNPLIDISLNKTVDNGTPAVGASIVFTITATNAPGFSTATGLSITDQLPSGFTYASHTASIGNYVAGTGIWSIPSLNAGASATLSITATVLATGNHENRVQVTAANETDTDSTPNNYPTLDEDDDAQVSITLSSEVCDNQVDDDGDGLIDCQDPDCPSCGCSNYDGNISFSNTGNNTGAGFTQVYVLTNALGTILGSSAMPQFSGLPAGEYRVYALNYETSGGLTNLMNNNHISMVTGGCLDISLPLLFNICACANITVLASSNGPIFAGSTLNLTSGNATGGVEPYIYNWTGPNGFSAIDNPNPSIPNATPAMSGVYTVIAVDANGCQDTSTVTVVVNPLVDLSVSKTVDNATPAVGSSVIFTVKTFNATGFSPATGIVVADQLPSGFSYVSHTASVGNYVAGTGLWSIPSLAAGDSATLWITATVLATGNHENRAQVTALNETDTDSAPNNYPTLDEDDDAQVSITLSTEVCDNQLDDDGDGLIDCQDPDCPACACDNYDGNISFNVAGQNTGTGFTQIYVLTDSMGVIVATAVSPQFLGVAAGNYRVYALNYETAGGISNLSIGNTIYGVSGGCIDVSLPLLFKVCACAAVSVSASSNGPIFAGSTLNLLSGNATGGVEPYTYNWTGPNGFSAINDPNPSIPNATPVMSGVYTVIAVDANGCQDTSTVTVVVNPLVDLSVSKTVDNATPAVGSSVIFTVKTFNATGFSPATGIVVADQMPSGFSYVSHTASVGNYVAGTGLWAISTLAAGDSATLWIAATVLATGNHENRAQVTALNETDTDSAPNNYPTLDEDDDAQVSITLSSEVCNNQLDDDGDGLIDCQDPDCPACDCNNYDGSISFNNTGQNTGTGFTQLYVLTDSLGSILDTASTPEFTGLNPGNYRVYALNYETTGGIQNLVSGNHIMTVTGGCVDISLPLLFRLCACPVFVVNATSNSPVYTCDTLQLAVVSTTGGAEPYTYDWSGPNGFSALNNPNPLLPQPSPSMSGVYTLTVTDANGCDTVLTLNVTVIDIDRDTLNESICEGDSITFGSQILSVAGTYVDTLTALSGCDSIVTLNLTVRAIIRDTLDESICEGDTYVFGSQVLSVAGTYVDTLTAVNTCDSIVTLHLTVRPVIRDTLEEWICEGATYTFGSQTLSVAGVYVDTLTAANACDSIVTLNLTVRPVIRDTISASICAGETYTFGTQTLSIAGTYVDTLTAANACDSIVTLNLTVRPVIRETISASICEGETYTFGTQTLSVAGTYVDTLTAANACDSIVTLNLTVRPIIRDTISASICEGETYTFGTQTLSVAGTYVDTLTAANACDSIVTLNLTVRPVIRDTISASICEGETYTFGAQTLSVAGTYVDTLAAANACDSIVTLNLTVRPVIRETISASICEGETYTFGTQTLSVAGTYVDTLTAANACDSIVTLNLSVRPIIRDTISASICAGETYTFGTQTLSIAGTYVDTLTAANACDSIVTLNLTVRSVIRDTISASICEGETYTFGTQTLSIAGTYTDTLTAANACDSIVTLNLGVRPVIRDTISASICEGETYTFGTQTLSIAGTYVDTLTAANACDSIVTLNLTVRPVIRDTISASICAGETYTFGTQTLSIAGTYVDTLTAENACDSIVTLNLTVRPVIRDTISASICEGETYTFGTQTLSVAGTYVDTLTAENACDSIVTLNLTVRPVLRDTISASICEGETYTFGTQTLSIAGTYVDTLTAANACDSIVTLNLTVRPVIRDTISASICEGETYTFGTQTLSVAGTYVDTLTAANACDSIVTLNLTVRPVIRDTISASICEGETYTFGTQTLSVAGTYVDTLTAANACDSIVTLNLTVRPVIRDTISASICAGETYTFGTQMLSVAGTYVDTLTAANACDSIVTLNLTVRPVIRDTITASICEGETYTFGSQTLSIAGTYVDTLTAANACDSIVTLNLTVRPVIRDTITASICAGETYTFGTQTLSIAGTYVDTLTAANACDSIVTLNLTVRPIVRDTISASICAGETYTFGTQTLSIAGTYVDTLTAANACDSIVTLNLTVRPVIRDMITASICEGETYTFGSQTLSIAGTYVDTLPVANACDSIVTLNLTVRPVIRDTISASICEGETYTFGTQTLSIAGTYVDTLTAANACDSIVTLNLSVRPVIRDTISASICEGATYTFGTQTLSIAGTYVDTLTAANACDSIVTLNLSVRPVIRDTISASINEGQTYTFGNQVLDSAGTYVDTLTSVNGCDSIVVLNLTVIPPSVGVLQVKVLLQGALFNTATPGIMRDDLRAGNYLSLNDPYTSSGNPKFTHFGNGGSASTNSAVLSANVGSPDAIVDWVFVELRSATDSTAILETRAALLQRDGDVVSPTDGTSALSFAGLAGNMYFVSVKHRNHLGAMTAEAQQLTSTGTVVDFTTMSATQLYNQAGFDGAEMVTIGSVKALWAGDVNGDSKIKHQGTGSDNPSILSQVLTHPDNIGGIYNYNAGFGYYTGDVNLDGKVKYQGTGNDTNFIFFNVVNAYPLNSAKLYNYDLLKEQLPF